MQALNKITDTFPKQSFVLNVTESVPGNQPFTFVIFMTLLLINLLTLLNIRNFNSNKTDVLNYDLRHEDTNCDPDKWVPISDINVITRG